MCAPARAGTLVDVGRAAATPEGGGSMPKVELDIETSVSPERVRAALLDFSERRPEIWPGITPSLFEVYAVGETSADIKERTKMPRSYFWAQHYYASPTPGPITW